jgi:hypothetical protein
MNQIECNSRIESIMIDDGNDKSRLTVAVRLDLLLLLVGNDGVAPVTIIERVVFHLEGLAWLLLAAFR